ncbi:MAG TPA: isoleucine--tRNA ligase [Spirochaetia bacterium]|nr:isoleucine--tRNA ligase [Spirochaetia bacterium]
MYKPVDPKVSFPRMEERVLDFWEKEKIFEKSIMQREGREEYVFYDGPPFATGLPHFGHFVPSTVKDVIPRYQTMKGYKVERRFGWDCHGLPVEYEMEKELHISGKRQIEEYGVAKFNEACRSIVLRYTREWRKVITRLGRWVDFDNDYKTMDPDYMESIWWVMSELWKKELLVEGFYILPYCPRCSTSLSNFELNLGGYVDVSDPAITVKFAVDGEPSTYFLAWTTTPWTLPSNLGLALGSQISYVKVKDGTENYILAEDRLPAYYKSADAYQIVQRYTGSQLAGRSYRPLFPFFADLKEKGAFRTWIGDFVSTEEGTGIVHIAPGFGEDDYNLLKGSGLPVIVPVDAEAKFTADVPPWSGTYVKDADKDIIRTLKEQHLLARSESHTHSYPHCWRCSSPLIYRAISSWFVSIEKIKKDMLAANDAISWVPSHLKTGRFGKWLENARDWAISRSRYWGNPLPIWRCEACNRMECIGSRAELKQKSGRTTSDLHKHFIDDITWACSCGGTMKRIPEVLDCWFESGAMPYGQNHYPFENKKRFEAHFPADFISESIDQTRGWFYTLVVLGAALFDKPTFRNVIVSGLILDSDGKKMSKSARNYTDPVEVIGTYGADAMRLFLVDSAVLKAEDLRYSDAGVKDVVKNVIIPLWNAYSFFVTYATIDKVTVSGPPSSPSNALDRWILSEAERTVQEATTQLDAYELQRAVDSFVEFIDLLNNWYIRRSRRRFWRSGEDRDKQEAYQTLHTALMKLILVSCPFIPFITEEIWSNLRLPSMPQSIHLADFPVYDPSRRDLELERKMKVTVKTVSMGRSLRTQYSLKTRQPLKALHLVTRDPEERRILGEMEELIREELNVKSVVFRENEDELVEYRPKANFRVLGKILGKDMKAAAELIGKIPLPRIHDLLAGREVPLELDGRSVSLTPEGVDIQRIEKENLRVINDGSLTVALDPELTPELIEEGMVRDLVRGIQNLRKEKGLEVSDRITLSISGSKAVQAAAENHREHLLSETLAVSIAWKKEPDAERIECGEETCEVSLARASR